MTPPLPTPSPDANYDPNLAVIAQILRRQEFLERQQQQSATPAPQAPGLPWKALAPGGVLLAGLLSWGGLKLVFRAR